jgi:hypothetical protein
MKQNFPPQIYRNCCFEELESLLKKKTLISKNYRYLSLSRDYEFCHIWGDKFIIHYNTNKISGLKTVDYTFKHFSEDKDIDDVLHMLSIDSKKEFERLILKPLTLKDGTCDLDNLFVFWKNNIANKASSQEIIVEKIIFKKGLIRKIDLLNFDEILLSEKSTQKQAINNFNTLQKLCSKLDNNILFQNYN